MIDVGEKGTTLRIARASAVLVMKPEVAGRIRTGEIPKGDPLAAARIAAVQAAKDTSRLIPYCHPIALDHVGVEFEVKEDRVEIEVRVKAVHRTGVEMEALTAASVAALTVYDMVKMLDAQAVIREVRLEEKRGGKTDFRVPSEPRHRAAVLVLSDSRGEAEDLSGKKICNRLDREGFHVEDYCVISDEKEGIVGKLMEYCDALELDLVFTTGGTGFSPRDQAPEALAEVMEREVPGIPEAMRSFGQARTPFAMLSRGKAGLRGRTLIVNLPGSVKAVEEGLNALFPGLRHSFSMIRGGKHS